ncbi:MAG: hypothetical protein QF886_14195, partial [Planctomycetota bacterium]|nr:hypothetical protein [Planctomycetota bacterium]
EEQGDEHWCAYAWPSSYGWTGRRAFFINESGRVHTTEDTRLSGKMPKKLNAGLAFEKGTAFATVDAARWTQIGE